MSGGVARCSPLLLRACRGMLLVMLLGDMSGHPVYALVASQDPSGDLDYSNADPDKNDVRAWTPIRTMDHEKRYGNHAHSQRAYLGLFSDKIVNTIRDGDFVLDLGGADGMNSVDILSKMMVKTKNFTYGLLDLPSNDWGTARVTLGDVAEMVAPPEGVMDATNAVTNGPCKYKCELRLPGMVHGPGVLLMEGSFYDQVAPSKSVNIAFSGTSVHFLSGSTDGTPMLQAQEDWFRFLGNRAIELAKGGVLYVTGLAKQFTYPQGSFLAAQAVLRQNLKTAADMGLITSSQAKSWRFPTYSRSAYEWTRPFDKNMIPELVLDSFQLVSLPSPYWTESLGDKYKFANSYVPSIMAWLGPYLEDTLGTQFAMYYASKLLEDIVTNPTAYKMDYVQAVIVIRSI